jgi:hypothetical protein
MVSFSIETQGNVSQKAVRDDRVPSALKYGGYAAASWRHRNFPERINIVFI